MTIIISKSDMNPYWMLPPLWKLQDVMLLKISSHCLLIQREMTALQWRRPLNQVIKTNIINNAINQVNMLLYNTLRGTEPHFWAFLPKMHILT
jgi:hypothetical protein